MNGPALLSMWWRDILTAHWRADADVLTPFLPAGLELDRFDGTPWLSVVPFTMSRIRLRFAPVFPGFASVPELNLRTYVRFGRRAGIFFFSLDADAPLAVAAARAATGLPYLRARIASHSTSEGIAFSSVRTDTSVCAGRFTATYRPSGARFAARPGTLAYFLHERYLFFVRRGRALFAGEVRHAPWQLAPATIEIAANTLGDIASHALSGPPEHVFFTPELHVRATAVLPLRRAVGECQTPEVSPARISSVAGEPRL